MDIEHIKEFILVANCFSFSKAAKLSNISNSVISRHIQQLESELGFKLIERNPHFIGLTKEGMQFLEEIEPFIEKLSSIISTGMGNEKKNTLRIGVHYAEIINQTYPLIKLFINECPDVSLEIKKTNDHEFLNMLFQGKIDIALEQFTQAHVHPEVTCIELKQRRFVVSYASSRDLRKNRLNIKSFSKEEVLVANVREHPGVLEVLELIKENNNIEIPNIRETSSIEVMLTEVAMGKGISVIPETYENMLPKDVSTTYFRGLPTRPLTALYWNKNDNPNIPKYISYLNKLAQCDDVI